MTEREGASEGSLWLCLPACSTLLLRDCRAMKTVRPANRSFPQRRAGGLAEGGDAVDGSLKLALWALWAARARCLPDRCPVTQQQQYHSPERICTATIPPPDGRSLIVRLKLPFLPFAIGRERRGGSGGFRLAAGWAGAGAGGAAMTEARSISCRTPNP